jgi:hypothetical protein
MKHKLFLPLPIAAFLILALHAAVRADPLYSPTWGFSFDPPAGYVLSGGDGKNAFSFASAESGASVDLVVYAEGTGRTASTSTLALAGDVKRRLGSTGDVSVFDYRNKQAAVMDLAFSLPAAAGRSEAMTGWGLVVELAPPAASTAAASRTTPVVIRRPMLAVLAYGPAGKADLQALHLSALDSLSPAEGDRRAPGPITEFSYPQKTRVKLSLAGLDAEAWFYAEDAEAAQAVVDREFAVLRRYSAGSAWLAAWTRFYRAVYRDSGGRLADAAFNIERALNVPPQGDRGFAAAALSWIQGFTFERDLLGSDFVNLVSAATEGRGDCDSRAMLWALLLNQADIPAAIMVSREYSHAMALADLSGGGARFPVGGKQWLVAETTAPIALGLIDEKMSVISSGVGISLE